MYMFTTCVEVQSTSHPILDTLFDKTYAVVPSSSGHTELLKCQAMIGLCIERGRDGETE